MSARRAARIRYHRDNARGGNRRLRPRSRATDAAKRVSGFIWRLHSIARYEERDGGVYLELEAIALTRDLPPSLQWLVGPVVNRLSINSLATTLHPTRQGAGFSVSTTEPARKMQGSSQLRGDSVAG